MKRIFLSPPHIGENELKFVKQAFKSNYIAPLGPQVDAFEKEFSDYTGINHCVALTSGTAAMHLALRQIIRKAEGGRREAEKQRPFVITSTLTFIGSITPVIFEGAKLVFVDCDRSSWNMDPELLAQELEACARRGELPKAVVPTDLYGQCCNLPPILEICDGYRVPVVCDSAEAMGAKYYSVNSELGMLNSKLKNQELIDQLKINNSRFKITLHAGVGAKASVFSFNGNKIMTTSGGGMLASDDKELIDHARFLSQQARDPFPHYEHSEIGYNYRMSNVLAAIGRGQLQVLDERVKRRREIFDYYQSALGDVPGIEFMPEPEWSRSNRWLTVMLITPEVFGADREQVRLALEAENIEARPVWKPMHMQPVFDTGDPEIESKKRAIDKRRYLCRSVGGQISEDLFDRGLCLPSGTAMSNSDLDRIVDIIRSCCQK